MDSRRAVCLVEALEKVGAKLLLLPSPMVDDQTLDCGRAASGAMGSCRSPRLVMDKASRTWTHVVADRGWLIPRPIAERSPTQVV